MKTSLLFLLAIVSSAAAAPGAEIIRNDKIMVYKLTLAPAETESPGGGHPSVTVFLDDGAVEIPAGDGRRITRPVKRGEAIFRSLQEGRITNGGSAELRVVRVDFLAPESKIEWGATGLAPDYRVLLENGFARVYDIRIAAGTNEPQHTHQDRVVIGLSGAQLRHLLPDGSTVDSNLKTGEIAWRKGQTHIGENVGKTDLWAIAIEPK